MLNCYWAASLCKTGEPGSNAIPRHKMETTFGSPKLN